MEKWTEETTLHRCDLSSIENWADAQNVRDSTTASWSKTKQTERGYQHSCLLMDEFLTRGQCDAVSVTRSV